jgi:hypothetical protein
MERARSASRDLKCVKTQRATRATQQSLPTKPTLGTQIESVTWARFLTNCITSHLHRLWKKLVLYRDAPSVGGESDGSGLRFDARDLGTLQTETTHQAALVEEEGIGAFVQRGGG